VLKLRVQASVEKYEKAEAGILDQRAFASPRVTVLAGWIAEPVSGVGKRPAQNGKVYVAGVVVAIEAEVLGRSNARNEKR
jgi:hypothetical protein